MMQPPLGTFAPCPASPNCVSTQADPSDKEHYLAPLSFGRGTSKDVMSEVVAVLTDLPRAAVVSETSSYLHAEVRSRIFRFVDDVEVFVDRGDGLIHFRSASRLGHGDFGVNRRRMEKIMADLRRRL